jgi:hypothetical protein
MGGHDSQKLLPWRGIQILSGAQQTSGVLQNQHCSGNTVVGIAGCLAARRRGSLTRHVISFRPEPKSKMLR